MADFKKRPTVNGTQLALLTEVSRHERWSYKGTLTVVNGTMRLQFPAGGTIVGWSATVNTAPAGAAVALRLNRNGASLDTGTIAAGANNMTERALTQAMIATDYLTIDITGVGTTTAGADLVITVRYTT